MGPTEIYQVMLVTPSIFLVALHQPPPCLLLQFTAKQMQILSMILCTFP